MERETKGPDDCAKCGHLRSSHDRKRTKNGCDIIGCFCPEFMPAAHQEGTPLIPSGLRAFSDDLKARARSDWLTPEERADLIAFADRLVSPVVAAPLLDPEGVGARRQHAIVEAVNWLRGGTFTGHYASAREFTRSLADRLEGLFLAPGVDASASRQESPQSACGVRSVTQPDGQTSGERVGVSPRTPEEPTPWQGDEPLVTFDGGDWHHDVRSDRVRIGRMEYPRLAWISALRRLGNADAATCSAPRAPQGAAPDDDEKYWMVPRTECTGHEIRCACSYAGPAYVEPTRTEFACPRCGRWHPSPSPIATPAERPE